MEVFGRAGTGVPPKQQVVDGQLARSVALTLSQQLLHSKSSRLSPRAPTPWKRKEDVKQRAQVQHLQGGEGRAAAAAWGPEGGGAQPGLAAAVEGGLDGDGGVAWAVEPQGLAVAGVSRVAGDDPRQVV